MRMFYVKHLAEAHITKKAENRMVFCFLKYKKYVV